MDGAVEPPPVPREFRGVWIATVANIDWPSSKELSTAEQQAELLAILDRAVELNLNAVVLQVRPMGDALYASPTEPWSEYLTGAVGRAPEPFYDPLEFALRACRERGLELHAWFNPYRVKHPSARSELPANHISRRRPDLVRTYGRYLWMDPGEPDTRSYVLGVVKDLLTRYDVDGIHIDDYFYPYPSYDNGRPFPDDRSWERYRAGGGRLERDDWRRENVNTFVREFYQLVRETAPGVRVGVSPFGIWRPNNPEGIQGLDQFAVLYADARKWWQEGWMDYLAPQLYWPIDQAPQSYPRLQEWWASHNRQNRHLWVGNFTSRVTGGADGWPPSEIVRQVQLTRAFEGATGNIHFSARALMEPRGGLAELLRREVYAEPALVPATPWLGRGRPERPEGRFEGRGVIWESPGSGSLKLWVVQIRRTNGWETRLVPAAERRGGRLELARGARVLEVRISAVNRLGIEGPVLRLTPGA